MTKPAVTKILLINLHSALNLGDDAIMAATLHGLQTQYPQAEISAAANDPQSWRKYPNLTVLPSLLSWIGDSQLGQYRGHLWRWPFLLLGLAAAVVLYRLFKVRLSFGSRAQRDLLQAYYQAGLVLSCGGGNYYAHHAFSPSLLWNLISAAFPVWLGKPVIFLPQSFGPIDGGLQRKIAGLIFSRAAKISVREQESHNFLRDGLGIQKNVPVFPDLAFALPGLEPDQVLQGDGGSEKSLRIGLTVINRAAQQKGFQEQANYEAALLQELLWLNQQQSLELHIFAQCYGPSPDQDDRTIAKRYYDQLRKDLPNIHLHDERSSPHGLIAQYRQLDLVIGTRLHTGIFSLLAGTPVLLIGYQPKARGMMALAGLLDYHLEISQVSHQALHEVLAKLMHENRSLRKIISERSGALKQQAACWTELLPKYE